MMVWLLVLVSFDLPVYSGSLLPLGCCWIRCISLSVLTPLPLYFLSSLLQLLLVGCWFMSLSSTEFIFLWGSFSWLWSAR
jgi:hypothetical protein